MGIGIHLKPITSSTALHVHISPGNPSGGAQLHIHAYPFYFGVIPLIKWICKRASFIGDVTCRYVIVSDNPFILKIHPIIKIHEHFICTGKG